MPWQGMPANPLWICESTRNSRLLAMMAQVKDKQKTPFDPRQTACGGFEVIVDA